MNVIVCIKQVPNDIKNNAYAKDKEMISNPNDLNALEEALKIRDEYGGKIIVLTMGPLSCKNNLKELYSHGVEEVLLLSDPRFAGSDTLATSYIISKAIQKIKNYDIVLLGSQSTDGETGQVGPSIANYLSIPHCTNINGMWLKDNRVYMEKDYEHTSMRLAADLPILLCVKYGINKPRIPSILDKISALSKEIKIWNSKDINVEEDKIGLTNSPTQVIEVYEADLIKKKSNSTNVIYSKEDQAWILDILDEMEVAIT